MYALMSYQIALLTERLVTRITSIRALTSMYALMSYQIALSTERLITHFTGIRTLTTMDVLMCYHTRLITVFPSTHFICVWMLTPLCITGISRFSTVYMKLFIWSALVKTERLNIRIYSDTKNNYFYSNV